LPLSPGAIAGPDEISEFIGFNDPNSPPTSAVFGSAETSSCSAVLGPDAVVRIECVVCDGADMTRLFDP